MSIETPPQDVSSRAQITPGLINYILRFCRVNRVVPGEGIHHDIGEGGTHIWVEPEDASGAPESVGQYMGMSHLNVTDNTMGHDFLRFTLPVELDP